MNAFVRTVRAAPHPYPLPVNTGEWEASAWTLLSSPRLLRGEDAGRQVRGGASREETP